MGSRQIHLCLDVSGAIRNKMFSGFRDEQGKRMSRKAAHQELLNLQAQGIKVIPIGERCEGFSYETGCPGHDVQDEDVTEESEAHEPVEAAIE